MYPHPRYCTPGDGDKRKAYQRAMLGLVGIRTQPGSQQAYVDSRRWPIWAEISHLCHHHKCCNPLHLVVEPCWRNRRRNYCGDSGQCDCGAAPRCLSRYTAESPAQPEDLCDSVEAVRTILSKTTTTLLGYS